MEKISRRNYWWWCARTPIFALHRNVISVRHKPLVCDYVKIGVRVCMQLLYVLLQTIISKKDHCSSISAVSDSLTVGCKIEGANRLWFHTIIDVYISGHRGLRWNQIRSWKAQPWWLVMALNVPIPPAHGGESSCDNLILLLCLKFVKKVLFTGYISNFEHIAR